MLPSPAAGHPLTAAPGPAWPPGRAAAGTSCRLPTKVKPPAPRAGTGPGRRGRLPGKTPLRAPGGCALRPDSPADTQGAGGAAGAAPRPPRPGVGRRYGGGGSSSRARPAPAQPHRGEQPRPQSSSGRGGEYRRPELWHPAPGLRTRALTPGSPVPACPRGSAAAGPGTRRPWPSLPAPGPWSPAPQSSPVPSPPTRSPRSPAVPGGAGRGSGSRCRRRSRPDPARVTRNLLPARPRPTPYVTPSATNSRSALPRPLRGTGPEGQSARPPPRLVTARGGAEGGGLPRAGCSRTAPPPAVGRSWGGGGAAGGRQLPGTAVRETQLSSGQRPDVSARPAAAATAP